MGVESRACGLREQRGSYYVPDETGHVSASTDPLVLSLLGVHLEAELPVSFHNFLCSFAIISYNHNLNTLTCDYDNKAYVPSAHQLIFIFTHIDPNLFIPLGQTSFPWK